MSDKFDEIELVNAALYMRNDLKNIPHDEMQILDKHFNSIVTNVDNINFRTACVDAFEYYKDKPALLLLLIRKITNRSIAISYSVVPEFKDVVQEYGVFLRKVRTIF